jgi:hypothetical protein
MRVFFVSVALIAIMAGAAKAESFTFAARTDVVNRIVAPVAGSKTIVAQFSNGEIEATYSSRKVLSKSQCATWPAPTGGTFTASGVCLALDSDGSQFTVVVSCRVVDDKNTVSDCFGQLTGVSGQYQGKTGTVSWRSTAGGEGKSSSQVGTGLWN